MVSVIPAIATISEFVKYRLPVRYTMYIPERDQRNISSDSRYAVAMLNCRYKQLPMNSQSCAELGAQPHRSAGTPCSLLTLNCKRNKP